MGEMCSSTVGGGLVGRLVVTWTVRSTEVGQVGSRVWRPAMGWRSSSLEGVARQRKDESSCRAAVLLCVASGEQFDLNSCQPSRLSSVDRILRWLLGVGRGRSYEKTVEMVVGWLVEEHLGHGAGKAILKGNMPTCY